MRNTYVKKFGVRIFIYLRILEKSLMFIMAWCYNHYYGWNEPFSIITYLKIVCISVYLFFIINVENIFPHCCFLYWKPCYMFYIDNNSKEQHFFMFLVELISY